MSTSTNNISSIDELISQMISDFEECPTSETFFDIGTVMEVVILINDNNSLSSIRSKFIDASLRWLRKGLIESAIFTSMENYFHCSLLCHLATLHPDFHESDVETIKQFLQFGIVTRNELPVLSQHTIAYHFSKIGIENTFEGLLRRNVSNMIDKRVLRVRSDEYDVLVLIMLAHIYEKTECNSTSVGLLNRVLLVQAIRSEDINRVAILLYLGSKMSVLSESLQKGATEFMEKHNPESSLLPLPITGTIDHEYVSRANRGLRLRSTIAQMLHFNA